MKKIYLGLFLALIFLITGCTSINDFDLTGQVSLYEYSDNTDYWKLLSSNDIQDMKLSNTRNFLFNILSLEGFYRMAMIRNEERTIPVTICNQSYIVSWDNQVDTGITNENGRQLELLTVKESSDGDWGSIFDVYDHKWTDKTHYFTKSRLYKFIEPHTGKEFKLFSYFRFAVHYSRTIKEVDGRQTVTDYSIKPSFRSTLEISYMDYLNGHTVLKGKKDKEYKLNISVYDENLDGEFNNLDVAEVHDFTGIFRLGQETTFDRKGKTRYFFDLIQPDESNAGERAEYVLDVKKVKEYNN